MFSLHHVHIHFPVHQMLYEKPVYQNLLETSLVKLQMKELWTPDIENPAVNLMGSIPLVLVVEPLGIRSGSRSLIFSEISELSLDHSQKQ